MKFFRSGRLTESIERKEALGLQQRLDRALLNANELETKNVHLQTALDEKTNENATVSKTLQEIAHLLQINDIPANDQVT